ncbi:MAG TPA: molybdate ABC transporter substrate-binding protein [Burkholderiales bacterium]|nr:molybdate ABC transporter substrate-binding protein [Burkholderiales bacterium]
MRNLMSSRTASRKQRLFRGITIALAVFVWAVPAFADNFTVFAAASLKDALDDVISQYEAASGNKAVGVYAASSALAKQIENGAPADIFISADLDWMDYLEARKLLQSGTRINLLRNRLVLIAPVDSRIETEIAPEFPLARLLGDGRLAMANPDSVPAGKYGRAALENLGVWASVAKRVAPTENVRAALALVSRGEAPLAIVYRTDALIDNKVRIVAEFPANAHPPIVYPAAVVASSQSSAARAFLSYLSSPAAREIWNKYGFGMAS